MIQTHPFGQQLLTWRRWRHLTQEELSRLTGIPRPNISDMERGRRDPTLSSLRRLALALKITVGHLLEKRPQDGLYDRMSLDALAREANNVTTGKPGQQQQNPEITKWRQKIKKTPRMRIHLKQLEQVLASRLAAARGSKRPVKKGTGTRLRRYLKAEFGDDLWKILETRLDKHAMP